MFFLNLNRKILFSHLYSAKRIKIDRDSVRQALLLIANHYTWIRRCLQQKQIWLIDRKTSAIHLFCLRFLLFVGFILGTENFFPVIKYFLWSEFAFFHDYLIFLFMFEYFLFVGLHTKNSGIRIRLENSRRFMTAKFILAASRISCEWTEWARLMQTKDYWQKRLLL